MRNKFGWYLAPPENEINDIWDNGEITVDANVLLDLYRYHESTRESIISALESFSTRAWLSDQAAQEFFRNRKAVIATSDKDFRDGISALEELRGSFVSAITKLRGYRLLNREDIDKLENGFAKIIDDAVVDVNSHRKAHPNYLTNDVILDRILNIFDGKVGSAPDDTAKAALLVEGDKRVKAQIPPGYLDSGKEGDRAFGDFFLWRQTLDHAKALKKPVILVTSERKEDWWERHLGKTVGPRTELLQEAAEYAGQRVLIYQTEHFLQVFSKKSGKSVSREAVIEIREVNARRPAEPAVRVRQIVHAADPFDNSGVLEIELLRPVYSLTGSGRLEPAFVDKATTRVKLVRTPDDVPAVAIGANSGTTYDFNVHIKSDTPGVALPVGTYVVEYESSVWDDLLEAPEEELETEERDEE